MAVKLRLKRGGAKGRPIYSIVAADSRSPRDGKFIEKIGVYNPIPANYELTVNEERALYWLNQGAQPTDTVKSLLTTKGLIAKHTNKEGK